MRNALTLFISVAVFSCASTKLAKAPVGSWEYTIKGTPNGDYSGVLTVSLEGEKYQALLKSQVAEIKFDEATYDKKLKKLTGSFYYEGNPIYFESTTDGDTMNGSVSAGGDSWPFKGTRKK